MLYRSVFFGKLYLSQFVIRERV